MSDGLASYELQRCAVTVIIRRPRLRGRSYYQEKGTRLSEEAARRGTGHHPDFVVTQPGWGVGVIEVACEVDSLTSPTLADLLTREFSNDYRALVVDFTGCGFMSSAGLAILLEARQRADDTDTTLILTGVNRVLARALDATALTPLFVIQPTFEDALTRITAV